MIDSYSFGRMKLAGKIYTKDLIIYPHCVFSPWWRQSGHNLCLKDIADVLSIEPQTLVIGTGAFGAMKVEDEVKETLTEKGINLVIDKTGKAVAKFNTLCQQENVVGAFHLSC
ncbi:MAG: Mth938-like domain-containing protein [Acidobacteriota bacterium]